MADVHVYDRRQGRVVAENVYKRGLMNFLFDSRFGFLVSEWLLCWRTANRLYGRLQKTARSRRQITEFIERYEIDLDEVADSLESFSTFNDFFVRRLKPEARPVDQGAGVLVSPADARALAYRLSADTVVPVKGRPFGVAALLDDPALVARYQDGTCVVLRLAPVDYHRFCYIDAGTHGPIRAINRFYRAISPMSLQRMKAVFCENYREITMLETAAFGTVAHVDVGAMGVGRVHQHNLHGATVARGDEKGFFEFGASTIILLLSRGAVRIDDDIVANTAASIETQVRYGERIGIAD